MSTFKKTKVVMLPTNEKAAMFINKKTPAIMQIGDNKVKNEFWAGQHLYFLSDEEIKEEDWCVDKHKVVFKQETDKIFSEFTGSKKIIATTDKSLRLYESETLASASGFSLKTDDILLPQPSTSFIEKFVEEYNKGNVITEVMVEYEEKPVEELHDMYSIEHERNQRLKINPKDNTITIRKEKDSWNRKEVEKLCREARYTAGVIEIDKWIEENI